jgi:arsenate reductase (thioredoxin)
MTDTVSKKTRVLFICGHNSGRSQMAEAFLRDVAGDRFQIESAGLDPRPINPLVIDVMAELGIDLSRQTSDSVFSFFRNGRLYDVVITVCDDTTEAKCPIFPGITQRHHWPFPDPETLSGPRDARLDALRKIRDDIRTKVIEWADAQ